MKFKLNESCILSDFEDGLLVLNVETGKYLELNSIAAQIIQYLKENLSIDEIGTLLKGAAESETVLSIVMILFLTVFICVFYFLHSFCQFYCITNVIGYIYNR